MVELMNRAIYPMGWKGWYTRLRGSSKWFECTVVGYDGNKLVIKTAKGYYHAHEPGPYLFQEKRP